MALRQSNFAVSVGADAICRLLDNGMLEIYDGVPPRDAEVTPIDQVRLATLRFQSPAFGPAINGEAVANPLDPDRDAAASSSMSWFLALTAAGDPVWLGTIGAPGSGADLIVDRTQIQRHAQVQVGTLTYVAPKG